jgi:hypothetical protein
MRLDAAVALLARADHVEERVVDPDGHSDQDDDDLHAVVEWEGLADRTEQAEGRRDCGQSKQHGNECGNDRTECEQQHDERHRH